MPAETPEIPREILAELRLIGEAVHQISHDIHSLVEIVTKHAPVLDAYQRGGILAARTARKAANGR